MTATEVHNLTISVSETTSVDEATTDVVNKTEKFAAHYGCRDQFDPNLMYEDVAFFFIKRKQLGLEQLCVHILEDGEVSVNSFAGRRKATLVFNIKYVSGGKGYL